MSVAVSLRLDFKDGTRLGPGKVRLLELIAATGSISAAGRAMGMSYKRAWTLVDELNRAFRDPVVSSRQGGAQGGGAELTALGAEIVARYRRVEEAAARIVELEGSGLADQLSERPDEPS